MPVPVPPVPEIASLTSTVCTLPSENAICKVPCRRPPLRPVVLADNDSALLAPAASVPVDGLAVSQLCPSSVITAVAYVTEFPPGFVSVTVCEPEPVRTTPFGVASSGGLVPCGPTENTTVITCGLLNAPEDATITLP